MAAPHHLKRNNTKVYFDCISRRMIRSYLQYHFSFLKKEKNILYMRIILAYHGNSVLFCRYNTTRCFTGYIVHYLLTTLSKCQKPLQYLKKNLNLILYLHSTSKSCVTSIGSNHCLETHLDLGSHTTFIKGKS
jgi:hypothetical protein